MDFSHDEFSNWLKEEYSFSVSYIYAKDYNIDEFVREFKKAKGL